MMSPGKLIGETALFRSDKVHLATAVSIGDAEVCSIDRDTFEKIINCHH